MNIQFGDSSWREIERFLQSKLETERAKIESPDLDISNTNFVRGRISLIKEILALPKHRQMEREARQLGEPDD